MAKISNTTAYPNITPVASDYLVLTDTTQSSLTKTVTVQALADFIDGEVTLLEVLNASPNPIPGPADAYNNSSPWNGAINLGANVIGVGNVAYISLDAGYNGGSAVDRITLSNGHLKLSDVNSDLILNGGEIKADTNQDLTFVVPSSGFGYKFKGGVVPISLDAGISPTEPLENFNVFAKAAVGVEVTNGNMSFTAQGTGNITATANDITLDSTNDALVSGGADATVQAGNTLFLRTDGSIGSKIQLGGPASNSRPDDVAIEAEDEINLKTFTGTAQLKVTGVDGIVSVTKHKFEQKADFLLDVQANGSSGNAGEVLTSGGIGNPTSWSSTSALTVGSVEIDVHIQAASTIATFLPGMPVFIANNPAGPNQYPAVDLSTPGPLNPKQPSIGIITTTTAKGNDAKAMVSGEVDIDTTQIDGAANINDVVYVGTYDAVASPLGLTVNRPSGLGVGVQNVGVITKTGANGSMQVSCVGRINDLPNIAANNLWAGNASGEPVSQDVIAIDVANEDITIGKGNATSSTVLASRIQAEVVFGDAAGTIGANNLQYGRASLGSAIAGSQNNTAVGIEALGNLTTGNSNIAMGTAAGKAISTTNSNIAIGHLSADNATGDLGNENVAIGFGTLGNTTANTTSSNVAIGHNTLNSLTTGINNTSVGHSSSFTTTTGSNNTCIGKNAATAGTTVGDLVAVGGSSSGGSQSVTIGALAESGTEAVSVGHEANSGAPSNNSVAVGQSADAQDDCISIGKNSTAVQRLGGNPMLAFSALIAQAMANAYVYPDNNAALAAGLQPGDVYCVNLSAAGIPVPGGAGGPCVMAIVY